MTHDEIEKLASKFVVDAANNGTPNRRVQEVTLRIMADLFKTIEDLDLSASEVWKGIEYFSRAGAANELGLLAAGLGLERFLDIRADEAEARAGLVGGTPRTIEGPLYVSGAPESIGYARLDDGTDDHRGEVLIMHGVVFGGDGKPLSGAKVEVWHANVLGGYSFFDPSQQPFNLRRTIITDENGRYRFRSIVPMGYGCPPEGTTQEFLNLLGRHGRRPAHIHFFVSGNLHRTLTTQINIDGDNYLWDDFAFASREGLVPPIVRVEDRARMREAGVDRPFAEIEFDFRLLTETAGAPPAEVDRKRVSA
ncbi:catechol 1,2-dioxygenase [Cupriavidus pinatubonensis]|uniref:catechol 1,2-dioxygenase n=1 Tax=Cupriavidus pinatubonensis TaxID=248026 RepID=A0ABM8Y497_9BURK|nr:catechol 1,2-dioxygenase [Cupriavidus pinatubonensis]CAG9187579.1 Catechol 1,2-dioxygenase [Cupriavidus pinatubonensis]